MTKKFTHCYFVLYLFAFLIMATCLSACLVVPTQTYYRGMPTQTGFVSNSTISEGEKLKEKYPDENFIFKRVEINYSFKINSGNKKNSKKEDKKGNKKKDDRKKKELPESPVQVTEENSYTVVALDDLLDYKDAIFYDETEKISSVKASYEKEKDFKSTFTVPTLSRNYEEDGIFHSDFKAASYSLPMYVTGTHVNIKYTRDYTDYRYLTSVYLPENYPCQEKVVSFEVPEGLDIEIVEYNFEGYDITRTEGELPEPEEEPKDKKKKKNKKDKKEKKNKDTEGKTKTINYVIKDAPASRNEGATPGPSHSLPHLLVLCKSYASGSDTMQLMGNTDDLYNWYSTLAGMMENDNKEIKKTAEKLIEGKKTDEEKISAIFYWVQDNIRYVAFEDGIAAFKPDECQNVYSKRYGDCKGMANLTKEMLKSVGYDARLTWIGTRRIAYPGATPSISGANHMICALYLDSSKANPYFLDATENYVSFGDYAHRIQGRRVVIEDGEKYIIDTVPEFDAAHNLLQRTKEYKIDGQLLKATVKEVYNGESKINLIRDYNNLKLDSRERALRTYLNNNDFNLTVSDIKHTDFDERTRPFEVSYTLQDKNHVITEGNKIFVNVERDREFANRLLDEKRLNHYSTGYKSYTKEQNTIIIPAGAKLERLPAEVNITNPYFTFKLKYTQKGNTIVYDKEIIMPQGYVPRSQIAVWNSAVMQLTAFYDNYIIFQK